MSEMINDVKADEDKFDDLRPLTNVELCMQALERIMNREEHLPGFACLYGPSGWGKTMAASYAYKELGAYHVEYRRNWRLKNFFQAILKEMGEPPQKTNSEMFDQIVDILSEGNTPLIIDEMDRAVERNTVEDIRDLHDASGAPILLIGEENLPYNLQKWERFYRRVLLWIPAQAMTIQDMVMLNELYNKGLTVGEELLLKAYEVSYDSPGRAVARLKEINELAKQKGITSIGIKEWGNREFSSVDAPKRRLRNAK